MKGVGRTTLRHPDIWPAADLALRRRVERMTIAITRVKRAFHTRPIGLAAAAVVIGAGAYAVVAARCPQR